MKKHVERLRGMHDLLPEMYQHQYWVIDQLGTFLTRAGYAHVDSPVLEQSDLFRTSFGQESWQNLYSFHLHHRDLCLRPEYTASICRLYLDRYQQQPLPLRFQYAGPIFRYEAPGRGRYRQHTQLGIELFGGHPASADAEILQLACDVLSTVHISRYRLELGHIGVASGFINRLHLDDHAARLLLSLMEQINRAEDGERVVQARLEALYPPDPLLEKVTDSRSAGTPAELETRYVTSLLSGISISFGDDDARHEIVERFLWKMGRSEQRRQILYALEFLRALHAVSGSPPKVFNELRDLLERYGLASEPLTELRQLVGILEQSGVPSEQIVLNLSLGRGVSYYTGLVFEIHAQEEDGFDTQLCGGGRYDRLVRAVGGPRDINACGFAFGVERLLSHIPKSDLPSPVTTQALVIPVSPHEMAYALQVARTVRTHEVRAEVDVSGHGVGSGLKLAAKKQIRLALIVGEDEQKGGVVTVRDLVTGEEQVSNIESLVDQSSGKGAVFMSAKATVRLALPGKGALEAATLTFLSECGLKVSRSNPRQYLARIKSMPDLEVVFQRASDIPALVQSGDAILGITGYDILAEHRGYGDEESNEDDLDEDLMVLGRDLGYGGCRLVVAVPETWIDVSNCADLWHLAGYYQTHKGRGLRIATKYPTLTGQFLRRHNITHCKIFSPHGALEAAPLTDTADLIVDLTETGTTLRENHLKLLDDGVVLRSQATLIGNARLLRQDPHALKLTETILELIDARMQSRNHAMLMAYMHGESLEAMQRVCVKLNQRLKSVVADIEFRVMTSELAGDMELGWYTISGIVDVGHSAPELLETVAVLRGAGAIHMNVIPLTYRFAEESASVRALRERLKRIR